MVFDVLDELNQWRDTNHPHEQIHFNIVTYTSEDDLMKGENGKDCHNPLITFDQPTEDEDKQPLLLIYSHNLNNDISALFEASNAMPNMTADRHRRMTVNSSVAQPAVNQSCGKHNLTISANTFTEIFRLASANVEVLLPKSFDINVCAGECSQSDSQSSAVYSLITNYLHTRIQNNLLYSNAHWGQCCAPAKYKTVEALIRVSNSELIIVGIEGISVELCSCYSTLTEFTM